jgi:hypothetical protein
MTAATSLVKNMIQTDVAGYLAAPMYLSGLWDGPDVSITLMRSGKLLFSEDPAVIAGIAGRVIAEVKGRGTCTSGRSLSGNVPVPELSPSPSSGSLPCCLPAWMFEAGMPAGSLPVARTEHRRPTVRFARARPLGRSHAAIPGG